jgi:CRP/FNR family transcriptional regulator, cyclic AMP receptor protein
VRPASNGSGPPVARHSGRVLFGTSRRSATGHDPAVPSISLPHVSVRAPLDLGTSPTVEYRRAQVIFSPDEPCDSVMYIRRGGVKLSVLSQGGGEVVVAVLGPGDFLGEECLVGEATRMRSAAAIAPTTIHVLAREEMRQLLRHSSVFDRLLSHVLVRHISMEQDLIEQLLSCAEKKLARTLLLLAGYGTSARPRRVLRNVSEAMLADMVGATPARISALLKKFRLAGFIDYDGALVVKRSLLSVLLHD